MVMKMNKHQFLEEIKKQTGYTEEKCLQILDVVDDIFLIGKKNKEKMINGFKEKLNVSEEEADDIYNKVMSIVKDAIKYKLKHPFKNMD